MDRFVSHYMLRLDAKGRVSVPAPFRAVLARDGFDGLYCYPALDRPALDAGGNGLLAEIEPRIAGFSPYSDEHEQFSLALFGTALGLAIGSFFGWAIVRALADPGRLNRLRVGAWEVARTFRPDRHVDELERILGDVHDERDNAER